MSEQRRGPADDEGVLSSLPSSRPQRRSPKRDAASRAAPAAAKTTAKPAPAPAKRRPAPRKSTPPAQATQGFEPAQSPVEPPSRTEMLASAVQVAGELAQLGLTLGEQVLRAAVKRLPKP